MRIVGKFSTSGALLSLLCYEQPWAQLGKAHSKDGTLPLELSQPRSGSYLRDCLWGEKGWHSSFDLEEGPLEWTQSNYKSLSPSNLFTDID